MLPNKLSERIRMLQWAVPISVAVLVTLFQLTFVRWIADTYGHPVHFLFEVLFYSSTGPLVAWYGLGKIHGWLLEKEEAEDEVYRLNKDLQARVEERTRELSEKNAALAAANAELQQLDRMKSEFVSLVSHELRAPLTNIRSALELIEGDAEQIGQNNLSILTIINEQASQLTRLVDEVLNVSRIEAGGLLAKHVPVDVLRMVDRVVDEFNARQSGHRLRHPKGEAHPKVWADPDFLYEVISNLVDNAIKYSPQDSDIQLVVGKQDSEGILTVMDKGPGIPAEELDRIFEKFHRLDEGDSKETYGYGLGLYISRRLLEAMDGRIWVESKIGQGTKFSIALPMATEKDLANNL